LDEALRTRFHGLSEKIADAIHRTSTLVEAEQPSTEEIMACNRAVSDIAQEFAALLGEAPEADRAHLERTHGRRVTDLRRLASRLPQKSSGQPARRAADATSSGQPFIFSREPPKSIEPPRAAPSHKPGEPTYRVGGEVEAWCGTCGGLTDHNIVAMVDGHPKQVICQACNARHGYRTAPARAKDKAAPPTRALPVKPTREQLEAKKREEARFALLKELAEATVVRNFSTKERYKAGEIVQHPEHGRGKIENVLRGSILVRFRDGLKSLSLL
jgi:hypothetical protein